MSLQRFSNGTETGESPSDAIAVILEDRREDGLRGAPPDAERETVIVTYHAEL